MLANHQTTFQMHIFDIDSAPEEIKKAFQKHFAFKRKQALKSIQLAPFLTLSAVLVALGMWRAINLLVFIGLGILGLYLLFVSFYFIRFQYQSKQFISALTSNSNRNLLTRRFGFDEAEIYYESEAMTNRIKWSYFESYEIHDGDIYAYKEGDEIADIFSANIMGEAHFPRFQSTISQKVPLKK